MTLQKLNIPTKTDNAAKKKMVQSNAIGANETLLANEVNAIVAKTNELVDATNNFQAIEGFEPVGRVATYAGLSALTNLNKGDAYQVDADGLIYIWNGTAFQPQTQGFDLNVKPKGKVQEGDALAVSGGEVFEVTKDLQKTTDYSNQTTLGLISSNGSTSGSTNSDISIIIPVKLGDIIEYTGSTGSSNLALAGYNSTVTNSNTFVSALLLGGIYTNSKRIEITDPNIKYVRGFSRNLLYPGNTNVLNLKKIVSTVVSLKEDLSVVSSNINILNSEVQNIHDVLENSYSFVQGGISLSNGSNVASNSLLRSGYVKNHLKIEVNDDYYIRSAFAYSNDGVFERVLLSTDQTRTKADLIVNEKLIRVVIGKVGGRDLTPVENFIKIFHTGLSYYDYKLNESIANNSYLKSISTNVVVEEKNREIYTQFNDVYNVFNEFVDKFQGIVSRTLIGNSRREVNFYVDSLENIPIVVRVSDTSSMTLGQNIYLNDTILEVLEIYNNEYLRLSGSNLNIASAGNIKNLSNTIISTYSGLIRGNLLCKLNNEPFYLSYVDFSTLKVTGAFVNYNLSSFSSSGFLENNDNVQLATYSTLIINEAFPIYRYDFNFSNNTRVSYKNRLLVTSAVHGAEKTANLSVIEFFKDLMYNWRNSEYLSKIRNSINITVIPVVNPWGFNNNTNHNLISVDINRNFTPLFTLTNSIAYRWSGFSALSEPESQAFDITISSLKDEIFSYLDVHNDSSYQGLVISMTNNSPAFINAMSKNISTFLNRQYEEIPLYLNAWTNGVVTYYTKVKNPKTGDYAYPKSNTLTGYKVITGVTGNNIIVDSVVYSIDVSKDVNYSRLYSISSAMPNGTLVRQADSYGIRESFLHEMGFGGFLTTQDVLKSQVEMTSNIIASINDYFMY